MYCIVFDRTCVFEPLNLRQKAIALSLNRCDIFVLFTSITKGLSQLRDSPGQIAFFDETAFPNGIDQHFFGKQLPWILNKFQKYVKDFTRQRDRCAPEKHQPVRRVDDKVVEDKYPAGSFRFVLLYFARVQKFSKKNPKIRKMFAALWVKNLQ